MRDFPFIILFFFITGWLEPHFTKFRFLVEPQDLYLLPNQQAILHCDAEVGGNFPRPTIKWKRDGQSLHFPDFNDRRYMIIMYFGKLCLVGIKSWCIYFIHVERMYLEILFHFFSPPFLKLFEKWLGLRCHWKVL